MIGLKLHKTGTLTMRSGGIELEGFEANKALCREVAALALIWAIGELQKELTEIIAQPGGTGICSVD